MPVNLPEILKPTKAFLGE